jgi:acetyl esterase/lipase
MPNLIDALNGPPYSHSKAFLAQQGIVVQPPAPKMADEDSSAATSAFGGPAFTCTGAWEEDCRAGYDEEMAYYADPSAPPPAPTLEMAQMFRGGLDYFVPQDEAHAKFDEMVDVETIAETGGPDFDAGAVVCPCVVTKVKGKPSEGRRCMVYYHGGGGIAGTPKQMQSIVNRYAVEMDVTVVTPDFRLAPEHAMPACVHDAYACLKWTLTNADSLGIDAGMVGIFGESSGGYVTAAVGVYLADKDEAELVRFQMPQLPMVSDMYLKLEGYAFGEVEGLSEVEKAQGPQTKANQMLWGPAVAGDEGLFALNPAITDPLIFPTKASAEQVAKQPPAVVLTTEFDAFKKAGEELAALYGERVCVCDDGRFFNTGHC